MKKLLMVLIFFFKSFSLDAFCQALFAPYDDIQSYFLHRIESEKKSIYGAIYMFTDAKIAQALVDAHHRGVDVQVVIDQISMGSSAGKGKILQKAGIHLFVHKTEFYNPYTMPLMHNKFFIFGKNMESCPVLWTGSWNCTLGGTKRNDENVLILDDVEVINSYLQNFFRLKQRIIESN